MVWFSSKGHNSSSHDENKGSQTDICPVVYNYVCMIAYIAWYTYIGEF